MAPPKPARPRTKAERSRVRAQLLEEVEGDILKCRQACEDDGRSWNALVGLQKFRAQLRGLDAPPPKPKRRRKSTGDDLRDHLADLRYLLDLATERGSVDSAARLTRQIRDVIDRIEARDAERRARELAGQDAESVLAQIVELAHRLPLPLRKALAEQIAV